ncbi:hypothetical protein C2845_PM13G25580 [Panicum miliaceum]|uniref:Uncharacterized protein n=1 Tax=Panicum miliaceum TaxID=4540 RepID=A0A3L6RKG3_PANMI|nr:hypothetical protein C2845_PM13G25580 [Panicum miliaceum]
MQAAYFKMYKQLTYKMDEEAQANIRLKLPYIGEWRQRLVGNRLLEGIYYFKQKTYELSEPEQQPHQLTFQEQVEQDKKRKREDSSKMVKYMRNRTAHRMEGVKKEIQLGQGPYEAEDTELATILRYPLSFVRLQEEFFDANGLQGLNMDELFLPARLGGACVGLYSKIRRLISPTGQLELPRSLANFVCSSRVKAQASNNALPIDLQRDCFA